MTKSMPLTTMQKAYLLGKSKQFPLSQSSMHDFRVFEGVMTYAELIVSLTRLVSDFAALRTQIDEVTLTQTVLDEISIEKQVDFIDLSELDAGQAEEKLKKLHHQYQHYIHNLITPPWRIVFVKMPTHKTVVYVSIDGLILDGFSISNFLEYLFYPEKNFLQPTTYAEDSLPTQPSEKDKQFWLNKLSNIESIPQLPWQKPLDLIDEPIYARSSKRITYSHWQHIAKLASEQRILPNAFLTTIILEILSKWNEDREVLVSIPISNTAIQGTVSNHSSFIVLHYQHQMQNIVENGQKIQQEIMQAMGHSSFSGVDISKQLIQQTHSSIVLPIAITNGLAWKKPVDHELMRYISGQTQTPQLALDLRLSFASNHDLMIDADYITQALDDHTIYDILNALEYRLLTLASLFSLNDIQEEQFLFPPLEDIPHQKQDDLNIISYLQRIEQQLFDPIHNQSALIYNDQHISYQTLASHVGRVRQAFDTIGLMEKQVVAICLPKCPEHIYVTLACALSNVIWLPIDMDSPEARRQYLLENSAVDLVVGYEAVPSFKFLDIREILTIQDVHIKHHWCYQHNMSSAYYLYTSGSTGTPKCVVLNNLATSNTIEQAINIWNINSKDIHLAATPFHHDMSFIDIFLPLSVGGTLVIPTIEQAKSAVDWAKLIDKHQVTVWCTVPAMVDMLLTAAQEKQLHNLRLILQGGDYVKPAVIQSLRKMTPKARLVSIGGPTETTIFSIYHDITLSDTKIIPYGKAIAHNAYYILNPEGEVCPRGVVGQMYMTGINLCNGYLLQGQLKQQDFVQLRLQNGNIARAYRMSDRGYMNQDGVIIFSGRNDGYLKVRGVRIAASEVENVLMKHPKVGDSVVLICNNPMFDGNELVGIYCCKDGKITEANDLKLRIFLLDLIPSSHIPTKWLCLERFPLTRNGKIDRKSLHQLAQNTLYATEEKQDQKQLNQEYEVIGLIERVLGKSVKSNTVDSHFSILKFGLTPHIVNRLAKLSTSHFNKPIDYYVLAECSSVNALIESICHQVELHHS